MSPKLRPLILESIKRIPQALDSKRKTARRLRLNVRLEELRQISVVEVFHDDANGIVTTADAQDAGDVDVLESA